MPGQTGKTLTLAYYSYESKPTLCYIFQLLSIDLRNIFGIPSSVYIIFSWNDLLLRGRVEEWSFVEA